MTTLDSATVASAIARQYLQFHLAPDVGPIRLQSLVRHFGSLQAVLEASRAELQCVDGIGPRIAESIRGARDDARVEHEIQRAGECGARIICCEDAAYPAGLRHIADPPTCLFVRGTLVHTDGVAMAIVGTRRCSHYGREQALRFGALLGSAGFTVVSGLARGIDGHAHRGAMQSGGRTIAVLGGGLGSIYPREHEGLAQEIAACGAVITESPIDAAPESGNFPRRNRIIAGLSLGVLVVEAGRRSGALITARLATEYNREVFAIPGRIDRPEHTAGVNRLIRDSQAKLVTDLNDIVDELGEVGDIMGADSDATVSRVATISRVGCVPDAPPSDITGADATASPGADTDATGSHSASDGTDTAATESRSAPEGTGTDAQGSDGARKGSPSGNRAGLIALTPHEQTVFSAVEQDIEDVDQITATTGLSVSQVTSALTALQLKGMVTCLPGNRFAPRTR